METNFKHFIQIRVRYGETDQMGYCYYGNYAQYFEVGRVETLREIDCSYKDIEVDGVMLPVSEYQVKYLKPAFYDDEITVITYLKEVPKGLRILFEYECFNSKQELLNTGKVTLVFIDKLTNKPCLLPDWFRRAFVPFFS